MAVLQGSVQQTLLFVLNLNNAAQIPGLEDKHLQGAREISFSF